MKFEYTVTKEGGEAEIMKAMSWKKLFKKLLMKYPEFSGWCTYINKKGHVQVRNFNKWKGNKKTMRVRDFQQVLGKFTKNEKGTIISDCPIYIETMDGRLEEIRK